jgi:hypothetical protein
VIPAHTRVLPANALCPEYRPDRRREYVRQTRFHAHCGAPRLSCPRGGIRPCPPGERNHRDRRLRSTVKPPREFEPIGTGHRQIRDDHIRSLIAHAPPRVLDIGGDATTRKPSYGSASWYISHVSAWSSTRSTSGPGRCTASSGPPCSNTRWHQRERARDARDPRTYACVNPRAAHDRSGESCSMVSVDPYAHPQRGHPRTCTK